MDGSVGLSLAGRSEDDPRASVYRCRQCQDCDRTALRPALAIPARVLSCQKAPFNYRPRSTAVCGGTNHCRDTACRSPRVSQPMGSSCSLRTFGTSTLWMATDVATMTFAYGVATSGSRPYWRLVVPQVFVPPGPGQTSQGCDATIAVGEFPPVEAGTQCVPLKLKTRSANSAPINFLVSRASPSSILSWVAPLPAP
jgi:hypothetical protein